MAQNKLGSSLTIILITFQYELNLDFLLMAIFHQEFANQKLPHWYQENRYAPKMIAVYDCNDFTFSVNYHFFMCR